MGFPKYSIIFDGKKHDVIFRFVLDILGNDKEDKLTICAGGEELSIIYDKRLGNIGFDSVVFDFARYLAKRKGKEVCIYKDGKLLGVVGNGKR